MPNKRYNVVSLQTGKVVKRNLLTRRGARRSADRLDLAYGAIAYRIAYEDVQPGDLIYNSHAYHPNAAWVRVTAVHPADAHGNVQLVTTIYTEHGYAKAGITVKRNVRV